MKTFFKFFFVVLMAASIAGCKEKPTPDKPEPDVPSPTPVLNENIKFTLQVVEFDATSAKIKITHDGTTTDTWYGFVTDKSNVTEAVTEKYEELTAEGKVTGLKKQTEYTATVTELNPQTAYYYIVFGITDDGVLYGKPASVKFTTKRGEPVMTENPAWTVEYTGYGIIGNYEYDHTISVTSTDKNKYFITVYEKEIYEAYDIKEIAADALAYLKEVVAYYQSQPGYEAITINDMLFEGNGMDAMNIGPGEWYGLAVGVESDGELSGYYAAAPFSIAEEEASEAYSSWLGDWTFTGANGIAWDVTINKGINNELYYLSGWEGPNTDQNGNVVDGLVSDGIEIPMQWFEEDGMWAITTTDYGTFSFGAAGNGNVWILGYAGGFIWPIEGLPICLGFEANDGSRIVEGYADEGEAIGEPINMEYMMYIAAIGEQFYTLSGVKEWPTFPIVVSPNEAAAQASADKENKRVQKFTQLPKPVKTYYQSYVKACTR